MTGGSRQGRKVTVQICVAALEGPTDPRHPQASISSQYWRLETQTQAWAGLVLLRPLSWACGRPSSLRVVPPCVLVCGPPLLLRTPVLGD